MKTFTTDELRQIADRFTTYASDQRGSLRWHKTKAMRHACHVRAETYDDVAEELREIANQREEGKL